MTRGVKADAITYEERVNTVLSLIYRGWTVQKIVPNITKLWSIEDKQARNYVYTARARIEAMYKRAQQRGLEEMIARHNDLRDKGYTAGDHRLVLDVDKEDAKLLGLYAPEKHEVDVNVRELDDAIERDLAELAAARQKRLSGEPEV